MDMDDRYRYTQQTRDVDICWFNVGPPSATLTNIEPTSLRAILTNQTQKLLFVQSKLYDEDIVQHDK